MPLDAEWVRRRRVLDTLLVVLFVFRLVFAPDRRGYATVAGELWDQCRRLGLELPRPEPVSAAALCKARAKVRAGVFRRIHRAVLEQAGPQGGLWKGHRLFAVDGSKLNLPRPLLRAGYSPPSPAAHYPQGLLSCLYQLRTRLPFDCELHAHGNERRAALEHLPLLAAADIVVYDRGYCSHQLLRAHLRRGLHPVFRLQRNANPVFDAFIAADCAERTVEVAPPSGTPAHPAACAWCATRPGERRSSSLRPCWTASATAGRISPSSTMPAGASKSTTRPPKKTSAWSSSGDAASAWSGRNCMPTAH